MKFRRIMCIILSAVTLFACFTFTALAAEESDPDVMKELSGLKINGEAFSTDKHLPEVVDEDGKPGLGIITVKETGYGDGEKFNLYIYIYNPSGQVLNDGNYNRVQIGINDDCELYEFFGIEIMSRSQDQKFLKVRIIDSSIYGDKLRAFTKQENENSRVYNIVSLLFEKDGKNLVWGVSQAFTFSGTGDNITCQAQKIGSLEVELHDTNWISPNAGLKADNITEASVYDHYELHTVYFRVPKEYWEKYGTLFSIAATYDAVHLTPIIVTRAGDRDFADSEGQVTKEAILKGTVIPEDGDLEIYDLFWENKLPKNANEFDRNIYTDSGYLKSQAPLFRLSGSATLPFPDEVTYHDSLAYYFATLDREFDYSDGSSVAKAAVSSEALEAYFYERYRNPAYDNNKLYSFWDKKQDLSLDGTMFEASGLYTMSSYNEILNTKSKWTQWWTRNVLTEDSSLLYDEFANKAEHIKLLVNPAEYSTITDPEKVSNELLISEADMVEFAEECQKAASKGEYIVLLRVGFNDYRCSPVRDSWEAALEWGPIVAVAVDKWVYLNISVAQLVFKKDEATHVVPVVSNVIDSFGDTTVFGDPSQTPGDFVDPSNIIEILKLIIAIIGIAILVFAILKVVDLFKSNKVKVKVQYPENRNKRE